MQERLPAPEFESPTGSVFPPPAGRRVYCNRNIRLDQVKAVGFDMDYTLAIYRQSEMDRQSIEATVGKLVERGYPDELLTMKYRTDFPIRGLLIDRKLGNVLKMDRHRYVKRAYHGFRKLTREERRSAYHTRRLRPGTRRYHWVDTLYALSEVAVYAAVVDHVETHGGSLDYGRLFTDIRECADLSHQDGSILDSVLADLPRFVQRDPELGVLLHKLRSAGKRLFLLTNSGPEYSDAMMSYLLDDSLMEYPSWRNYFDYVVTASKKPGFFVGKAKFTDLESGAETREAERGHLYAGGNFGDFQRSLGYAGDEVLYVGDHIYGDVLRAKKESTWRTAMIIQEMDSELRVHREHAVSFERSASLEQTRQAVQDQLREQQARLKRVERKLADPAIGGEKASWEAERVLHRRSIDRLRSQLKELDAERLELDDALDQAFHPFWGSVFKAGGEVSSFGNQVEQYACIYTSRASNLAQYSPMHYFQSPRHRMPHET
ncbi:MAG: HAD-IG family 5'-nucleotidase [Deltaproteobacteria bacterium]|nr:HAD-IG family 5'-nucleotidase [Deltaproteobacteria bacterium]